MSRKKGALDPVINKASGDVIRELLKDLDMTHEKIAKKLNISTTQIWKYTSGQHTLSLPWMYRFSSALFVSVEQFLSLVNEKVIEAVGKTK